MPIQNVRYKCDNCFDFDFCENCFNSYAIDRKELKTIYSTSHKSYHTFTKFMLSVQGTQPKITNGNQGTEIDTGLLNQSYSQKPT